MLVPEEDLGFMHAMVSVVVIIGGYLYMILDFVFALR
jgi:hypothetical protein